MLRKRRPDLMWILERAEHVELSDALRDESRDVVSDELMEEGLEGPPGEAELRAYGRRVDDVIGALMFA